MYRITNNSGKEQVVYLLDHTRVWNGRVHVILMPDDVIDIHDDQLSVEMKAQERKGLIEVEDTFKVELKKADEEVREVIEFVVAIDTKKDKQDKDSIDKSDEPKKPDKQSDADELDKEKKHNIKRDRRDR